MKTETKSPFDFVKSITSTKEDMSGYCDQYVPAVVNRALSFFPDTILDANEMNLRYDLTNEMQYRYLLNSIKPRYRYSKWVKRETKEKIDVIMAYYKVSHKKANEILEVLTDEQINVLKSKIKTIEV